MPDGPLPGVVGGEVLAGADDTRLSADEVEAQGEGPAAGLADVGDELGGRRAHEEVRGVVGGGEAAELLVELEAG